LEQFIHRLEIAQEEELSYLLTDGGVKELALDSIKTVYFVFGMSNFGHLSDSTV